jgi:hypothetical protein
LNIFAAMSTAVNGKEVCVICADATHEVVVLNCCENHMCTGCVARAKTSRVASLKEIVVQWGSGRAHQCPKCGEGPVEHFACNYLGINAHNQCPVCAYISTTATDWPKWDGEIPQRLTDMAQAFLCPYCRDSGAHATAYRTLSHATPPRRKAGCCRCVAAESACCARARLDHVSPTKARRMCTRIALIVCIGVVVATGLCAVFTCMDYGAFEGGSSGGGNSTKTF